MGSLLKAGIRRVVFSSTCATYGEPEQMPISETCPQWPKNPYGWSKFTMERLLESYDHAYGLKFVALRYFNASGATENRGEHHEPESHLVPNVLSAASGEIARGRCVWPELSRRRMEPASATTFTSPISPTRTFRLSTTCARDGKSDFINLGTGHGYSVLEVIQAAEKVTGTKIRMRMDPPRPGDPARLVADAKKAARFWAGNRATIWPRFFVHSGNGAVKIPKAYARS